MPKDRKSGYKCPPEHSRFKPGQSGNPKGRPKGRPNIKALFDRIFSEKITLRTPKGPKQVTGLELVLLKLREQVARGDLRAIEMALRHLATLSLELDHEDEAGTAEDADLVDAFVRSIRARDRRLKDGGDDE